MRDPRELVGPLSAVWIVKRITDFSVHFVAEWKDGQFPKAKDGSTVVNYDQTSHAYDINADDAAEFIEWVAINWHSDNEPFADETARAYLDRRGINIRVM